MVRCSIALALLLLPHAAGAADASERARQVLKGARCGMCHDSKVSAENAKALAAVVRKFIAAELKARAGVTSE